jgi:hypothetical protein
MDKKYSRSIKSYMRNPKFEVCRFKIGENTRPIRTDDKRKIAIIFEYFILGNMRCHSVFYDKFKIGS